eukprot:Pompholyxophrys_punicea_v1_NODE_1702_length_587_cov_2.274436.p2 type:complete len:111 gc:universal NODE_1702_length_587_cov_2.274436:485-153(-)
MRRFAILRISVISLSLNWERPCRKAGMQSVQPILIKSVRIVNPLSASTKSPSCRRSYMVTPACPFRLLPISLASLHILGSEVFPDQSSETKDMQPEGVIPINDLKVFFDL